MRTPWLRPLRAVERSRMRLYCFPHAGGSASVYGSFAKVVDPRLEVVAIQYPGRGDRLAEAPVAELRELVRRLVDALPSASTVPTGFVGLSFGSLVAWEAARELRRRGELGPSILALGGRAAPHVPPKGAPFHHLPQAELVAELVARYGDPDGLLADPEIADMVLPSLRADVQASAELVYRPEPPLDVPLLVFAGREDREAVEALPGWREHTTGTVTELLVEGGHFVFAGDPTVIAAAVSRLALQVAGG